MANMSHCRFRNTERDLEDCHTALESFFEERGETLSDAELQAAKDLVHRCFSIVAIVGAVYGCPIDETDEFESTEAQIDNIIDEAQYALSEIEGQDIEGDAANLQH